MIQRFKEGGYKNSVIYKAYNKAKNINRDELLVQRQKFSHSHFVTQYSTDRGN